MRETRFEKKLKEYKAYKAAEEEKAERKRQREIRKAAEELRLEKLAETWISKLEDVVNVALALECPVCSANIYAGQKHMCRDANGNGAVIFILTAEITMQRKKLLEEKK